MLFVGSLLVLVMFSVLAFLIKSRLLRNREQPEGSNVSGGDKPRKVDDSPSVRTDCKKNFRNILYSSIL